MELAVRPYKLSEMKGNVCRIEAGKMMAEDKSLHASESLSSTDHHHGVAAANSQRRGPRSDPAQGCQEAIGRGRTISMYRYPNSYLMSMSMRL